MKYVQYGETETEYLKRKDKRLAEVIDRIGHIDRPMDDDLYSSVVHHIIGQQISSAAQKTIWNRLREKLGEVTPERMHTLSREELQACGMTFRKAEYILDFTDQVVSGQFDLAAVAAMDDAEAIAALSRLKGIGVWTAEMILLFALGRKNIFAYDDLAVQRGLRMVYHHRKIDRKLFEKYRRRFSPYCSVASLYFWKAAAGALPELKDYAPKKKQGK
ncbi:MAG: DNA-3-methyladenine glycosylase 2 family protein [Solobacterium sp.]|nr:DNA-3-methyladenine glycosylase 2 family protein [Solobacterium sp.]MBQ1321877.1 DNA-3-methyladenine glycosylase 2 family protein [Solobacterium sp.]MBQ1356367.1 DNA-3-methyladenine glycosylase 2 family protein [Solobacterium sp.]